MLHFPSFRRNLNDRFFPDVSIYQETRRRIRQGKSGNNSEEDEQVLTLNIFLFV
jgi:hypothetical protein